MMDKLDMRLVHPEEWSTAPIRCRGCGLYYDPDELTRFRRGFFCTHCVENQESDG